jgi:hypothetical protein
MMAGLIRPTGDGEGEGRRPALPPLAAAGLEAAPPPAAGPGDA